MLAAVARISPHVLSIHHLRTMASESTVPAKIIDGTALAKCVRVPYIQSIANPSVRSIRESVAEKIKAKQTVFPRFQPQLAIVQAGERPDSSTYVRMKAKAAEQVGIKFRHINVPIESSADHIIKLVQNLNTDENINGILVQLPLGGHITPADERLITEAVSPEKDVDG
jgi:methylenetetrahydrofolate dehydrogenase (NADP+)/methenyltetrahydrofolate cyclohydrolase/formyltetrahydrofolate synthetase